VFEKIRFLWPLPQRKFPKVPNTFQTFYRWYRLIYRCFISFALYFCLFSAFYVLFKTHGKTLLISGEGITYATFLLYAISLQYQEIEDSERSGFLGRLFLLVIVNLLFSLLLLCAISIEFFSYCCYLINHFSYFSRRLCVFE